MSGIKHYFAGSHSSRGFYSLYDEALKGLDNLYILKGGPGTGKSTVIRKVGERLASDGYDIEFLHCSSDNHSLDGVLIPALKAGIVDGTAPHIVDPKYPGAVDRIVNLGDFRDDARLRVYKDQIISLTDAISATFQEAYEKFADAKKVHDEIESIYIRAMDFDKANQVTETLMATIFAKDIHPERTPTIKRLFSGAATPNGPVCFYDNLTSDMEKRYIIKGRAGSGKSTMMKKIAARAEQLGLSHECYYCAFDPNSLDMVIIPSLKTAILDGTAPHVVNPSRSGDEIVDMFELCINAQVEIDHAEALAALEASYQELMKEGIARLAAAKEKHDQLETYYVQAMDFEGINLKTEALIKEISDLIECQPH
ncbi:PRK06851 family protein [Camelliibacillus cellulosilyticus]|uniref:PRK06851 family protein n=1 Tax=Camelliibacillus cellulosilyticus TaxID=2174486 RepID=A0ABV9GPI6_9BACL